MICYYLSELSEGFGLFPGLSGLFDASLHHAMSSPPSHSESRERLSTEYRVPADEVASRNTSTLIESESSDQGFRKGEESRGMVVSEVCLAA